MQALGGWDEVRDNASLNRRYLKVNDHQEVLSDFMLDFKLLE